MADDKVASPSLTRLSEDRPEVVLARDLLKTEYDLIGGRRGGGAGSTDRGRLGADAGRVAWPQGSRHGPVTVGAGRGRLLVRRRAGGRPIRPSRVRPGPAESVPASTSTPAATAERQKPSGSEKLSGSEKSARKEKVRVDKELGRLPDRKAFEDAVLEQLRGDENWKKAFEESPWSMPDVAKHAIRAHLREALADRPPSFDLPQAESGPSLPDGDALCAATPTERMNSARDRIMAADAQQHQAFRERFERSARPPDEQLTSASFQGLSAGGDIDGHAFKAMEDARAAAEAAHSTASPAPPSPLSPPSPVDPARPVSPLSPVSSEGHDFLRQSLESFQTATSGSLGSASNSSSASSASRPSNRGPVQTSPKAEQRRR